MLTVLVMVAGLAACGSFGQADSQADKKMSEQAKDQQVAPKKGDEKSGKKVEDIARVPSDPTLKLTIPKMERIKDRKIPVGEGTDEALLRENAAIHLKGTGNPWEKEANVYIAGHRLGYSGTGSYLAFYDIDKLKDGDQIYLTDADGQKYTYKVFKTMVVKPTDLYVLNPVKGKNIVSLQACTLPDYSNRVIVQAELEDVKA
ncbi:MAG TPA: class E sortase [Rubrobacteraceae bacterium]|nr:class E sortase [Rubrobacteraceae bacterium]